MDVKAHPIRTQAQVALLAFLKEKSPETQRCFFKNTKKIRKYYGAFQEEVLDNYLRLSPGDKRAYIKSLSIRFAKLHFPYDSQFLRKLFREYGQNLDNFPEIDHPELYNLLNMDCSSIWKKETSPEGITRILETQEIQRECLLLYQHLKLRKIMEFLESFDSGSAHRSPGREAEDFRDTLQLSRQAEIHFLEFLKKDFNYFDSTLTGLKTRASLQAEKQEFLRKGSHHTRKLLIEIDNNLMLLSQESAERYLARLDRNLAPLQAELDKYQFDLLHFRDPHFNLPELELQLKQREDIVEMLKELSTHRRTQLQRVQEKLGTIWETYSQYKAVKARTGISLNKLVCSLDDLGFFSLPRLLDKPNTDLASLLSVLTGHNQQNLRRALGELQKPNPSRRIKENMKWAVENNGRLLREEMMG